MGRHGGRKQREPNPDVDVATMMGDSAPGKVGDGEPVDAGCRIAWIRQDGAVNVRPWVHPKIIRKERTPPETFLCITKEVFLHQIDLVSS